MKILYAIQGTGNGHLSRAIEMVPALEKIGHVDVLISGQSSQLELPFPIKFNKKGLTFRTNSRGGISYFKTLIFSSIITFIKEIYLLPVQEYDLVVSDFEPVSAWSSKIFGVTCIEVSHQSAILMKNSPRPSSGHSFAKWVLRNYCPSKQKIGIHFCNYNQDIFTPVIRQAVRNLNIRDDNFFLAYLSGYYDDQLIRFLSKFDVKWKLYSKYTKVSYRVKNVIVKPIDKTNFLNDLAACTGVFCGAGFELPSEVIYLKKKLAVMPLKGQFEQICNAHCLKLHGITVVRSLKSSDSKSIQDWIDSSTHSLDFNFKDCKDDIVQRINFLQQRSNLGYINKTKLYETKSVY